MILAKVTGKRRAVGRVFLGIERGMKLKITGSVEGRSNWRAAPPVLRNCLFSLLSGC